MNFKKDDLDDFSDLLPRYPDDGGRLTTAPDSIRAPIELPRARIELLAELRPTPLSQLGPGDSVTWLWEGYIARDHLTLFTGLWKAGKTTLITHLLCAFGSGGDLAGRVEPARVLIVSEESRGLWARRRDELGIGDHVHVFNRPIMGRPNPAEWRVFIDRLAELVKADGYGLVVFDTISAIWPVDNENEAAKVLTALSFMHIITSAGAAVLLVHHPRKGDGAEGQASRGSGALPGFVDIILELRRYRPEDHEDCRRSLTALSRFDETPAEVVIELADDGYRTVGTKADAKRSDRLDVIGELLPVAAPGMTAEEVRAAWPTDGIPQPGHRTIQADLREGVKHGFWLTSGKGSKGDPYRYWHSDSIRARSGAMGAGIESGEPVTDRVIEFVEDGK